VIRERDDGAAAVEGFDFAFAARRFRGAFFKRFGGFFAFLSVDEGEGDDQAANEGGSDSEPPPLPLPPQAARPRGIRSIGRTRSRLSTRRTLKDGSKPT
jgi:hypothetical protein